jgi:beta-xylosidase
MKTSRFTFVLAILLLAPLSLAQLPSTRTATDTYCNPLDVLLADPFIFHERDTYYLYATAADDGILVWTSQDLVNWRLRGHAFARTPTSWARHSYWAPELFTYRGKYYLHFTAVGDERHRRIVLCVGDSPLGPFREVKAPWFDPGQATIDSDVFTDTDGSMYLYSVQLPRPPDTKLFEIQVRRLDASLVPEKKAKLCIKPTEEWEGIVNEGPFLQKRNGTYYLTYSCVGYISPEYSVDVATSNSPLGSWSKNKNGPILRRTADVSGPGHHCFIDSPDGKEMFIAYHTHQHLDHPGGPRQLAIDRAWFVDTPEKSIFIDGPTVTPVPMPSGAAPLVRGESDEFDEHELNRRRWNIFSEDPTHWSLKNGQLTILTQNGDIFQERSDISNVFLEYAPLGDFEVTTKLSIQPQKDYELGFLGLWQNHNQYIKLAVLHSHGDLKLEVGSESSGRFASRLHPLQPSREYWLRIRKNGDRYDFLYSSDGERWRDVDTEYATLVDIKAALGACSPESGREIPASFDFLRFSPRSSTPPSR